MPTNDHIRVVQEFAKVCNTALDKNGMEQVDFAGSDSLLTASEYSAYPDLQMFPSVFGLMLNLISCVYCQSKFSVVQSNRPYDLKNSKHAMRCSANHGGKQSANFVVFYLRIGRIRTNRSGAILLEA